MKINKSDIRSFTYDGNDTMIKFKSDKIPAVHKDFRATLKLKNGKEVPAPKEWRKTIWEWWYSERKEEVSRNILRQVSADMLAPNNPNFRKRR